MRPARLRAPAQAAAPLCARLLMWGKAFEPAWAPFTHCPLLIPRVVPSW